MLYVGDDWAEDHHDVELMDTAGRRLAKARLPEGVAGIERLHAMIAEELGEDTDGAEVLVGIETERGPWVAALLAAGYTVYAVNPLQAARYRERHSVSGAKSDSADAHVLADMVRTDSHQLRSVAADSSRVQAIKVVARVHKTLIWERTRHVLRLRHALREYFPAALEAFDDLDAADTLALLAKAPDPASAAKLTRPRSGPRSKAPAAAISTPRPSVFRTLCAAGSLTVTRSSPARTRPAPVRSWRCWSPSTSRSKPCRGRWRPILASTRTLRLSCPSPAWDRCSVPGCSANSVMPQGVTPMPRHARTTPAPVPSPARRARRRS